MSTPILHTFRLTSRLGEIDAARRWASEHARRAAFEEEAVHSIELALTEALSNVIRHSYAEQPNHRIELDLTLYEDRLRLDIRDLGCRFDRGSHEVRDLDTPRDGGYGVMLIEMLMDEVVRETFGRAGNRLSLVKYRTQGAAHG